MNLQVWAGIMDKMITAIGRKGWIQDEATRHCAITQPRMNDLMRGRVPRFSFDALENIAASVGARLQVNLRVA